MFFLAIENIIQPFGRTCNLYKNLKVINITFKQVNMMTKTQNYVKIESVGIVFQDNLFKLTSFVRDLCK